jgi:hypothetical protein
MGCLAALLKDDCGLLGCHGDLVGNGPHVYWFFDVHEITDPETMEKDRAGAPPPLRSTAGVISWSAGRGMWGQVLGSQSFP